ncbi:hypothetical protein [Xenorhabdus innexi]|uniref:Uncharacterized protein n=1 Tax=Xenorhabdus innexi TaxID=290109 RepID=A0A1N6MYK7_9GAMM|nr:hypothetical protein [Xenorhabdus innexi]PHM38048.1 hypothetical protein Xinn_00534 [Xenorhabdus innexi]SIP73958.1 membrane hypothetical protein [Xenorhabdus innexi]
MLNDLLDWSIKNYSAIASVLSALTAFLGGIWIMLKNVYSSLNFLRNRRITNNIDYLEKYDEYLSQEDKTYIKEIITSEIMLKVTKIKSKELRHLVIKLTELGIESGYIFDIKRLKKYVIVNSDFAKIKIDASYVFNYWIEKLMSVVIFALMVFIAFKILYVDSQVISSLNTVAMIFLMIILELLGICFLTLSVSPGRIRKINAELSKHKLSS